ncbi:hypothetical protein PVK64_19310 [Aliivibrio sp. S4TY2]|uniref:hypothetical protein n=1 Tax=unclassified Aliivibrio TaxID=2645654 RepID=UPI0023782C60|nr:MULTISPECIES: hypothetical protein [unclassified Aliivibrio]MDD9158316.1 hypothetical protein [Aliivibrio sp. S4TY2]MDD9162286.1 hypothetical protein [Aliivibrio sp. S4TY1]MDD9166324.1 hypothetical protein [Aliivibrio sp. S4MY2]MDD9170322.1 hypothetical protein [Aliivibrio sp. S4MY4]MDD9187373.1 hypothetical protein [Aliivibrio sp. S4MY3]
MFFEGPPIISQGAAPTPASVLLMRAGYLTQDANPLKQTLAADNAPETILFNVTQIASPDITVDLVSGEVTAVTEFNGMTSINALVLRESSPFASSDWGMFAEVLVDGSWVQVEGSLRPLTLGFQFDNEKRPNDFTVSVSLAAGQKFRWRHYTTDASSQVSLVSFPPLNGLPSTAGVMMSFWGVKP